MIIDILQISRDARTAKRQFPHTIDASIGMFIDEDGYLGGLPVVFDTYKQLPPELSIPYPAVDGGQPFKDNVFDWVFQEYASDIKAGFHSFICATPGGSGAIATVFNTQVPKGEAILVSDIRWQYDRFAGPANVKLHAHLLFDGIKFNLASFEQELMKLCDKQYRVTIVMNDPCHNPSGYTLTLEEWDAVLNLLNRQINNEIIFLYDLAYIDYSCEVNNRLKASHLLKLAPHVHVFVAFSGSKTFGAYGMRMGALIGLSRDDKWLLKAKEAAFSMARGTWSATPTPAVELLNKMLSPELKPQFLTGLGKARATIIERGRLFLEEAQAVDLPIVPYKNGFYVIVKCEQSHTVYEKLTKELIYAVPIAQGIRLALCSLPLRDIRGLARRLKNIIFGS